MAGFRNYVQPGMRVVGADGEDVGTVTKLRVDGFLTTNPPNGEANVPYDSIQNVLGDEIVLNIPVGQVGNGVSARSGESGAR